jgi:serine/threonine-protein kinase
MTFTPGSSVGPYRILGPLGRGGMGEVYHAQDVRLGRDVALKVLPDEFAHDPDRRSRFDREARVLASLNHPNIATLHGLQELGDRTLLEMELVSGETLEQRIHHGALPVAEALVVFRQIALALEAAHDRGIIHRDLKPANVKIMPEGRVKVLDFGLAKALEPAGTAEQVTWSPTATASRPGMGLIMGTAAYMSPEQARGISVDRRTDVWSFGCMFYQALTGRLPFAAPTTSDVLAAILKDEPDWSAIAHLPRSVQRIVKRCLRKDVSERLRDIADARLEIDEALAEPSSDSMFGVAAPVGLPRPRNWMMMAVQAVAAVALFAAGGAIRWLLPIEPAAAVQRVAIPVGGDRQLALGPSPALALSADGTRLVYAARVGTRTHLFSRELNRFEAAPIAGTEGASAPFFSPDGQWVGFFAGNALQKVALGGGAPFKVADAPSLLSASWGADGAIVFATTFSGDGLWRVDAAGGTPEALTTPNAADGEIQHAYPQIVDGTHVLFTIVTTDSSYPAVLSMSTRTWSAASQVRIASGGVQYLPTGHLLYAQGGGLVAVPFDIETAAVTGSPLPLREALGMTGQAAPQFVATAARDGALVYVPAQTTLAARTLVLLDRDGRAMTIAGAQAAYSQPRFSPDGQYVAVTVDAEGGSDVWVYDLRRGARTRLTTSGASGFPVWTPDGRRVSFHASRPGPWNLYARAADGSTQPEPLLTAARPERPIGTSPSMDALLPGSLPLLSGANPQYPAAWTPDGKTLVFTERKPSAERDIWTVTLGTDPVPFLVTPFDESSPVFSPDGRFLAYVSDETGRNDVYVQPYPGPGGRWLVSPDGGEDPVWSADGRELIFRRGDELIAASVQTAPTFAVGGQRRLFEGRYEAANAGRNYDVAPDGRRFVMVRNEEPADAMTFHVVLNWFSELKRP